MVAEKGMSRTGTSGAVGTQIRHTQGSSGPQRARSHSLESTPPHAPRMNGGVGISAPLRTERSAQERHGHEGRSGGVALPRRMVPQTWSRPPSKSIRNRVRTMPRRQGGGPSGARRRMHAGERFTGTLNVTVNQTDSRRATTDMSYASSHASHRGEAIEAAGTRRGGSAKSDDELVASSRMLMIRSLPYRIAGALPTSVLHPRSLRAPAVCRAAQFVEQVRAGGETVRGLRMRSAALARSRALRNRELANTVAASDRGGVFAASSRTLRLFLQSMMFGLGAWLAIRAEVTPGIMIAVSILLGRALAPIDQAVGQWPVLQRALRARRSLADLLSATPEEPSRTSLPAPEAHLEAENLVVMAPGAAVRGVSLRLKPGRGVGIAGPSACVRSTLAKALAGV